MTYIQTLSKNTTSGFLYIVATPIGNLQDITIRAIKTLFEVDYICAEQPDKTSNLLNKLLEDYPVLISSSSFSQKRESIQVVESYRSPIQSGMKVENKSKIPIKPKIIAFNEAQEQNKIPEVISYLQKGSTVALVSEAGTPLLSDPGFKLVREAVKRGIMVTPIPGPSSITSALSASPLPTDKFLFLGFLPKSEGKKVNYLIKIKETLQIMDQNNLSPTVIIFESPHRLLATLEQMKTIFGNIELIIARELTKIHEEIAKRTIQEYIQQYQKSNPVGEIILLFSLKD